MKQEEKFNHGYAVFTMTGLTSINVIKNLIWKFFTFRICHGLADAERSTYIECTVLLVKFKLRYSDTVSSIHRHVQIYTET